MHLTLDDLRSKFKKHTVAAALQCTGNRRHELKEIKEVQVRCLQQIAFLLSKPAGLRLHIAAPLSV